MNGLEPIHRKLTLAEDKSRGPFLLFTRIDAHRDATVTVRPPMGFVLEADRTSSVATSLGWETTLSRTRPQETTIKSGLPSTGTAKDCAFSGYSLSGRLNLSVSATAGQ